MGAHLNLLFAAAAAATLIGCAPADPNAAPAFGKESGLPSNCRAFVQYAVDSYRRGEYAADPTFSALERNCGAHGNLWASK